jgi:hypothetical protein
MIVRLAHFSLLLLLSHYIKSDLPPQVVLYDLLLGHGLQANGVEIFMVVRQGHKKCTTCILDSPVCLASFLKSMTQT